MFAWGKCPRPDARYASGESRNSIHASAARGSASRPSPTGPVIDSVGGPLPGRPRCGESRSGSLQPVRAGWRCRLQQERAAGSCACAINELGREHSRYVEPQTLLLTNSGATLGVPKITHIGGCINDGVAALLDVAYPLKLYLLYFLRTQTEGLRGVNQGAAQPNLNTTIYQGHKRCAPTPRRADADRGGSGAAVERGGAARSGGLRQPPARQSPAAVHLAESFRGPVGRAIRLTPSAVKHSITP